MIDRGTIAAIATGAGAAGIGIVRISGSDAAEIAERIFRRGKRQRPVSLRKIPSHRLLYGTVIDPATEDVIDEVLLGWMAAPNTYTREDVVEISCHGGSVTLSEVLRVVLASGARMAEPGEFTLRAFLNGRLDLAQAEAVLSVINAQTAEGMRLAVADLSGALTKRLQPARDALVGLMAHLDALADFPDDEVPPADIEEGLATSLAALEAVLAGTKVGRLHREGAQVALVGRPNVGKSSLMNALLREDRAIVTPIAGTTRDVISETAQIGGFPVTLLDTAGIAPSDDPIEQLGIERSRKALQASAAALFVLDGTTTPTPEDIAVAQALSERIGIAGTDGAVAVPVVVAVNKRDMGDPQPQDEALRFLPECPVISVSAVTAEGLPELEAALATVIAGPAGSVRPTLLTARQQAALERAYHHLQEAETARQAGYPLDLLSVDIRAALHAIGSVTGEQVDEAVLDEIFRRFCIGK